MLVPMQFCPEKSGHFFNLLNRKVAE